MRTWICLTAALALYAGVAVVSPRRGDPVAPLRDVSRPLLLPFLWNGLERARREGTPGEFLERGRFLLRLLPRWVEGHVWLADRLAFAGRGSAEVGTALDRLDAALVYLEEARRRCPERAEEILVAMAFLVEFRTRDEHELAAAFRERHGNDPREVADAWLRRAERLRPASSLRARRAYLAKRLVAPALRRGDRREAIARIDRARELLRACPDPETAAPHLRALDQLRAYLTGNARVTLEALRANPWLEGIVETMEEGIDRDR